jgi:superfamily II DNA or RNA helicase
MTPPPLRPYQLECLNVLKARYKAGKRRPLVSLPTGTGKTVVFASFPSFFNMQRKMLVLAHREELLDQACRKLAERSPGFPVGVEQGQRQAPDDARVVLA